MASNEAPEVGDKVAWNWGSSHIEGVVKEKSEDKMTKTSKGKQITRNGEPDNPAYFVEQTKKGNPVVKKASELEVLESSGGGDEDSGKKQVHKEAPPSTEHVQTRAGAARRAKEAESQDDDE